MGATGRVEVTEGRRSKVTGALRLVASAVILVVLLQRVDLGAVIRLHTFGWLAGALAVTLVGIVLSALRWQRVLAALGLQAGLRPLVSHYLASLFVGNVLPSDRGRRRAPGQPAVGRQRRGPGHLRVGGARAAHRLDRAPRPHARRHPAQPRAAS